LPAATDSHVGRFSQPNTIPPKGLNSVATILDFVLAACALYILFVEGVHALALWNVLPVAIGLLVARGLRRGPRTPMAVGAGAGFLAGAVPMSLLWHAAWQFDLWRTATCRGHEPGHGETRW
jgi:hypothetical protein